MQRLLCKMLVKKMLGGPFCHILKIRLPLTAAGGPLHGYVQD